MSQEDLAAEDGNFTQSDLVDTSTNLYTAASALYHNRAHASANLEAPDKPLTQGSMVVLTVFILLGMT